MNDDSAVLPLVAAFRRSLAQQRGFVSAETAGTIFSNPPPSDTELQAAIEAALQASQQSKDATFTVTELQEAAKEYVKETDAPPGCYSAFKQGAYWADDRRNKQAFEETP